MFGFFSKKKKSASQKSAAVFIDYEHWYIALDNYFHVKPDIASFSEELKKDYRLASFTFFGDFSNPSLQSEMHTIRAYTNDIVETKNGGAHFKKDFTDFIMLDHIYQTAYKNENVDTYVIFTGDSHFTSAVLFLKNVCGKEVVVYGVKNAFSGQLKTAASRAVEVEPVDPEKQKIEALCGAIVKRLFALESANRNARPTFMKTIDAVAAEEDAEKVLVRKAMDSLFDRGLVTQYVKDIGGNQVKLLKMDYKACRKAGYPTA